MIYVIQNTGILLCQLAILCFFLYPYLTLLLNVFPAIHFAATSHLRSVRVLSASLLTVCFDFLIISLDFIETMAKEKEFEIEQNKDYGDCVVVIEHMQSHGLMILKECL